MYLTRKKFLPLYCWCFLGGATGWAQCPTKIEQVTVNGESMSPLLHHHQELKLDLNYYSCRPVKRGDIVAFEVPGKKNRIIKRVLAIPADKFEYKDRRIHINGLIQKNSKNLEYILESKMLKLFAASYPVVPKDSYLVLGDNPGGSFDGSKYGFISRQQIVGRIINLPKP